MQKMLVFLGAVAGLAMAAGSVRPVSPPPLDLVFKEARAVELVLPGPARVVLRRYQDGRAVAESAPVGEDAFVVVVGYGGDDSCAFYVGQALITGSSRGSGHGCVWPKPAAGPWLHSTLPQRVDSGVPYPAFWVSYRDGGGRLHQVWWVLWWQGR